MAYTAAFIARTARNLALAGSDRTSNTKNRCARCRVELIADRVSCSYCTSLAARFKRIGKSL